MISAKRCAPSRVSLLFARIVFVAYGEDMHVTAEKCGLSAIRMRHRTRCFSQRRIPRTFPHSRVLVGVHLILHEQFCLRAGGALAAVMLFI